MEIVRNKDIGFGQPTLKNTRLTVFNIISNLNYSVNLAEYLEEFGLNKTQVLAAITYCKNTCCGDFKNNFDRYCDGCLLSTISEGKKFDRTQFDYLGKNENIIISKDDKFIFLGNFKELEASEMGLPGWVLAEEVEYKFSTQLR